MVICAVLISIFAVFFVKVDLSAETEGIYEYNVSSSYATITAVNGTLRGHLTIPSKMRKKTVNQINSSVFKGQTGLTSVTIPDR